MNKWMKDRRTDRMSEWFSTWKNVWFNAWRMNVRTNVWMNDLFIYFRVVPLPPHPPSFVFCFYQLRHKKKKSQQSAIGHFPEQIMVNYRTSNLDIKEEKNKQRKTASERKEASETYQHEFHFSVFLHWSWTRLLKKKMFTHKHSHGAHRLCEGLDLAKSSI